MSDWDDLRFFLAIARAGSMSAAAKVLEVAQPTVGRRLAAFERSIGSKLFVAVPGGQMLTETGQRMIAHAEKIEEEVFTALHRASGRDTKVTGTVRVTASEWLVDRVVAPLVGPLTERYPELEIELMSESRHVNLLRREADIALRPSRFEHQDIVEREVAKIAFGLYASERYLDVHGEPRFEDGCRGARLVAMPQSFRKIPDLEWLPRFCANALVVARANGRLAMAALAQGGVGMTVLPVLIGDAAPTLRRLSPPAPGPQRRLFASVHGDARDVPRVRVTLNHLASGIARLKSALAA